MRSLFQAVVLLTILVSAFALSACSTNPATGKTQLNMISRSQAIQIGDQAEPKFVKSYGGEIPDPEVVNYVRTLGQKLAAVTERPNLPWRFHAVDSKIINAFSIPGGKVFITRGLLAHLNNKAQLAGILGHEIGHVTAEHVAQQMTQRMILSVGISAIGAAGQISNKAWLQTLGAAGQVGSNLYMLHFSREDEEQADKLGVRYMTRLGYNPVAQIQVMHILKKTSGSGGIEMLQTHPLPQTRINYLKKYIQKNYPNYDKLGKYKFDQDSYHQHVLDQLKRLPPAKNMPRQGG